MISKTNDCDALASGACCHCASFGSNGMLFRAADSGEDLVPGQNEAHINFTMSFLGLKIVGRQVKWWHRTGSYGQIQNKKRGSC